MDILEKIDSFVKKNSLISPGNKILLSLSAGKDSIFMLNVFLKLAQRWNISFSAFHLNHKTRNGESDLDARFVEKICGDNGIDLFTREFSFDSVPSFEEAARNKRYELIDEIMNKNGFDSCATAHNHDDNCETVLMRLFAGTSLHGMTGISPRRGRIIRPVLGISVSEIYAYLELNGLEFRYDSSNDDAGILRNYVRRKIVPVIEERFPDFRNSIGNMMNISLEAEKTAGGQVKEFFERIDSKENFVFNVIRKDFPRYVFNKFISDIFRNEFGMYITGEILSEIWRNNFSSKKELSLYSSGGITLDRINGRGGVFFVFYKSAGKMKKTEGISEEINLSEIKAGVMKQSRNFPLRFEIISFAEGLNVFDENRVYMDVSGIDLIKIETRKDGERILLEGKNRKLKDVFISRKMTADEKDSFPVIKINGSAAALPFSLFGMGLSRISDAFRADGSSKKILAIRRA